MPRGAFGRDQQELRGPTRSFSTADSARGRPRRTGWGRRWPPGSARTDRGRCATARWDRRRRARRPPVGAEAPSAGRRGGSAAMTPRTRYWPPPSTPNVHRSLHDRSHGAWVARCRRSEAVITTLREYEGARTTFALPPGPPLPRVVQGLVAAADRRVGLAAMRTRYGPDFTVDVPIFGQVVVISEPAHVEADLPFSANRTRRHHGQPGPGHGAQLAVRPHRRAAPGPAPTVDSAVSRQRAAHLSGRARRRERPRIRHLARRPRVRHDTGDDGGSPSTRFCGRCSAPGVASSPGSRSCCHAPSRWGRRFSIAPLPRWD